MTTIVGSPVAQNLVSDITVADIMFRVARNLALAASGTADSGSTVTCVDAARLEEDDYWNEMAFWRAATPNEVALVSDYVLSTHTLTFSTLGVAIAANSKYYLSRPPLRYEDLFMAVAQALTEVPRIPLWYQVGANSEVRELNVSPSIAHGFIEVYFGEDENDWTKAVNPRVWQDNTQWKIRFPHGLGTEVRILYSGYQEVTDPDEYISSATDPKLLTALATLAMLLGLKTRFNTDQWNDQLQRWSRLAEQYLAENPPVLPNKSGRILLGQMT